MQKDIKKYSQERKKDLQFIWIMLLIPILHWLIFWLYVNFGSILLAFQLPDGSWSFTSMYSAMLELTNFSSELVLSLKNTFIYFIKDFLMIPFQLFIAYFLYKKIRGFKFFRLMFYLPSMISGVALVTLYSLIIAPYGPLGDVLTKLGVEYIPQFLADSRYATWAILIYTIWLGWGGNMLILGGAMVRIPIEIFESAKLEGTGFFREVFSFVFPLLWPTLSTLFILNLTGIFNAGGPILLFDSGKLDVGISTLGYWIFKKVYKEGVSAYNEVAATGLILTVIGMPIILFLKSLIEKVPQVEY